MGHGGGTSCLSGEEVGCGDDVSGFVESKEQGEALVAMIGHGARLDFRPSEPNWIQVKMVVEFGYKPYLENFIDAVAANGNMVTPELVTEWLDNKTIDMGIHISKDSVFRMIEDQHLNNEIAGEILRNGEHVKVLEDSPSTHPVSKILVNRCFLNEELVGKPFRVDQRMFLYKVEHVSGADVQHVSRGIKSERPTGPTQNHRPIDLSDFKKWGDDILDQVPMVPQTQRPLGDQLRVLQCVANKLGLYDAADSIGKSL